MKKISKRCFQLLEVIIAMFLVTVCILPIIHPHIHIYQEEHKALRSLEADHLATLIFADIAKKLYNNEIDWVQIKSPATKHPIDHPDLNKLSYTGYYTFSEIDHRPAEEPPEKTNYLIKVGIYLSPDPNPKDNEYNAYDYRLFIQRKIKQGQDTDTKKEPDTTPKEDDEDETK